MLRSVKAHCPANPGADINKDGEIDIIFNTTEGWQSHRDSASIRASAVVGKVPYFTTAASSAAVTRAIAALRQGDLEVRSLQDYYSSSRA